MRAEHEVQIDRPVGEVFDFLADGTNNARWKLRVVKTTQIGGSLGTGTTFRQTMRHPLGFNVSANYRITAFEQPRLLSTVITSGGPIRPIETYELTEAGSARTTLRYVIEYQPHGLARAMAPFLALVHPLFAMEAKSVDRARDILQSGSASAGDQR